VVAIALRGHHRTQPPPDLTYSDTGKGSDHRHSHAPDFVGLAAMCTAARLVEGEMKWGLGFIGTEARAGFVVPKSVCGRWIWMDDER
jgi:hypothetical protein